MSDTTPRDERPDEPGDPTAPPPPPPPPAEPTEPMPPAAPETAPEPVPGAQPTPPPPPPSASSDAPPPAPPYGAPAAGQPYGGPPTGQAYGGPSSPKPLSPQEEKTWGMLSHVIGAVAMIITSGVLGFVGSLVIYVLYKDRGPFVRAHAANSLNIQITTAIGVVISFALMLVLIGFITIFLVGIWAVVMHIIGAIKANNGEWWDPPLVPKFVR